FPWWRGAPSCAAGGSYGRSRPSLSPHRPFGRAFPPVPEVRPACLSPFPGSADDVGQKREEARALDGAGEFTLLLGGNRRDAARNDLAALRDVALQELHVLVIDLRGVGAGEGAGLATAEEGPARGGC